MVLMIFRPQGLFPVRQKLLAYGRAARELLRSGRSDEGVGMTASTPGAKHRHAEQIAVDRGTRPASHREIHGRRGRNRCLRHKDLTGQVRRADRPGLGDVRHQARRDPRPDRAERRRQDHLLQRDHRRVPADLRHGDLRRARRSAASSATRSPARHRPHVPEHPAVRRDDRAGERRGRHRRPAPDLGARRACAHAAAPARGARGDRARGGAAAFRRHRQPRRGEGARTCPTATSAGWRSPGRWPPNRSCSAWTSRPPGSTRRRRPR